ncbi:pyrimidine 5'-nucleotidase [Neorhizobium sp. P12A]|uniref:pyrimidine 5'-nucleotidase n=1 Tax=Neorhizobium sp. P12A TaxID=2268027 RepID=UPI0011F04930|nr:pyrimidine 5'-nucleotidase [Neorhizobium sp. P12A]KAA0699342.1 pyrimidine 5'-nucleotidase [Neorhizobium sp. P12A]
MTQTKTKPAKADFADIRDWVFDLDNTLYPHHVDLFSQIDKNMTAYVSTLLQMERDEARKLQKQYYLDHGTTLQGLMIHHGVDPDDFLEKAHAIDYSHLMPQPELASAIKALPGRKFIFTNGSVKHAQATAGALGILDHFDDIFDIVAAGYVPKPASATYDKFKALNRVDTKKAVMFEDLPRNLTVPKALGMRTVLLVPQNLEDTVTEWWERHSDEDRNVDYITDDLTTFLNEII